MATRTLEQIISELNASSQPLVNQIKARQDALPNELIADEQAAQGAQNRAFDNILTGARRRGLGFSGVPLGEQAKYSTDVYLPELTRARNANRERGMSLTDALLGIYNNNQSQARSLYQSELDREEQQRQFNANLALQQAQFEEQRRQAELARQAAGRSGGGGGSLASIMPSLLGYGGQTAPQAQVQPQQDEIDAQYLGRLMQTDPNQRLAIIASLRKAAKAGNQEAVRRFELGKQLGYWKF